MFMEIMVPLFLLLDGSVQSVNDFRGEWEKAQGSERKERQHQLDPAVNVQ
jgi:hypothetical protein